MGTTSTQPVCAQWGPTLLNVSLTFSNGFDLADVSTTYFVPLVMITLGHNGGNSCDTPSYTLVSLVQNMFANAASVLSLRLIKEVAKRP